MDGLDADREALLDALRDDDPLARIAAAEALDRLADARTTPALIAALDDRVGDVSLQAAQTLGRIALHEPSLSLRAALPALRRLRRSAPGFQEALHRIEEATAGMKDLPLHAVAPPPDPTALPIPANPSIEDLGSADPDVRKAAILAAGRLGDTRLVPALIDAARDDSSEVRTAATAALALLKDERALPVLVDALRDWDAFVRSNAAEGLREFGDARAAQGLIAMLADRDSTLRQAAAEALGQIALRDPAPALRAAIPPLRRLRKQGPVFARALDHIEASTATTRDLPMSAAVPAPDPTDLPLAAAGTDVPLPPRRDGLWERICRRIRDTISGD